MSSMQSEGGQPANDRGCPPVVVYKAVHKEPLDFLVSPRIMAKLSQRADSQLEDLVLDAVVEVELGCQSGESIIRCRQLLRRSGRHFLRATDRIELNT